MNEQTRTYISKKILLFISLAVFALLYVQMKPTNKKEIDCTAMMLFTSPDSLFEGANMEFSSAGKCDHCHGLDPSGLASVDAEGGDVNVVDDWSSSMMALSAKDPYWRAKVSHEVFMNPALQEDIETTCTKCHAPLGNFAATMNGATHYSIAEMLEDSVALDGVSCLACHSQTPQPEVALHTGQLIFVDDSIVYGPYFNPLITPMALYSGYTPEQSFHIKNSKLCAACHSLKTETVDLEGNLTGSDFIEQATWHEWLNSSYPLEEISCQQCHLPELEGQSVKLAAGYDTPPRAPFGLHTLAGGNVTMLKLMRDNREQLGIYPSEAQFNETISNTQYMLQEQSLQVTLTEVNRTSDTLYIDAKLTNLTGHKLPSGYPARKMTVVLYALTPGDFEIFRSGGFDDDFYVVSEDTPFEPHHNFINDEDQVQIYEMVMGDVNGERTNVLLRGASHLKDNRLVPLGFAETGALYDTTEIVLGAPDNDFNHDPAVGSGTDVIHYSIPTNGLADALNVYAEIYYQSIPPNWVEDLESIATEEAETFIGMFDNADKTPVLMRNTYLSVPAFQNINGTMNNAIASLRIQNDGKFNLFTSEAITLSIYDLEGKLLQNLFFQSGKHLFTHELPVGVYLCTIKASSGFEVVEKILVH